MFVKITKSGPRQYVQLVESYRDDQGRSKSRTVATLGRLDKLAEMDSVISGLIRLTGSKAANLQIAPQLAQAPVVEFESARAFGDVWALDQLWKELGFDTLAGIFRQARYTTAVEHIVRVMVFNRLCDPDSKLGVLRWLETVSIPEVDVSSITHQRMLRSMDALMEHHEKVANVLAKLLRPLIDQDLSLVFYDLTTIRAAGLSEMDGDVRRYGMAKEGLIARQFMLGVVQTAEGLPIYHEVFDGNQSETKTLMPTLKTVLSRYPQIKRLIVVADRGLLSLENIEELGKVRLSGGAPLEFIVAVPGRRYHEFAQLLEPFQKQCAQASTEITGEVAWNGLRLAMAHDPDTARSQGSERKAKMDELEKLAATWTGKLQAQDQGQVKRGRRLSDSGAKARFYHEVCEAHLGRIIKVDLKSELFAYTVDEPALTLAQMMDGKLLLVSNVADLTPVQLVQRYKSLADIERGFRVLKSEIEIAPVHHRLPQRIRAHALICFIALIMYRVMRTRLRMAKADISPARALEKLRRIQHHSVTINASTPICGVSTINTAQAAVYAALNLKKPSQERQMSLL